MRRRPVSQAVGTTPRAISAALRRMARPAGSFDATRYFRGDHGLKFYNVGTDRVRALARDVYAATRERWTVEDAMRVADVLMRDPHLETKSVGIELVGRYRKSFTPALLARWKGWLSANLSANWATTDTLCGLLIGPLLVDHAAQAPRLRTWSRDRNMWVRRASAVGLERIGHSADHAAVRDRAVSRDKTPFDPGAHPRYGRGMTLRQHA